MVKNPLHAKSRPFVPFRNQWGHYFSFYSANSEHPAASGFYLTSYVIIRAHLHINKFAADAPHARLGPSGEDGVLARHR
jgi:hypothetical protein